MSTDRLSRVCRRYNLGLVWLVHKALAARNRTAVMYYGLTGTLGVEIDALVENLQALRAKQYHQSGTFTRVFFQEPCAKPSATCAAEKPNNYQTAKGPEAHWGVLHLLRVQVGVPAATPAPYAATGINTGTGPCHDGRTIGTSRCLANVTNFVPSRWYPLRSPLVSVDYLIDSLLVAGRGTSQTLAILGKSDRDLFGCLAEVSPMRTVYIRSHSDTTSLTRNPRRWANAWYWHAHRKMKWHSTAGNEYTHGGPRSSVSASVGLVNMLDKELRRRGERGNVFIGLDGYAKSDMLALPELIHELNGTRYRGTASLTRLPFDESDEFGAASARSGPSAADEMKYPIPVEVIKAKMGKRGHRRWRQWGIWHVLSVQIGVIGNSSLLSV